MSRAYLFLAAAFFILLAPANALPADTGVIEGKINCQGKPLEGAAAYLYSDYKGGFQGRPDYQAGPTAKDGVFIATVAPGRYYLIAKRLSAGGTGALRPGDFYAFYGGNPVTVGAGETIHIGINCAPVLDAGPRFVPGGTGIRGRVYADGKPLGRARVTLYEDGDTIFRGIGYASMLTNGAGAFSFSLEPGSYYVVARKRKGGDSMGPLAEGDRFAYSQDNPVPVKDGSFTVTSLNAVTKLIKVKQGGQAVTLGGTVKAGETLIEGTVTDRSGRPVAGVYASAYRDSMMTQKPDFISPITGSDGRYAIALDGGGEYFIGARNTIGGPAEKGDLLGQYAGKDDHSVVVKTGEKLKGVDITVGPVE